jgi:hypothetical protein
MRRMIGAAVMALLMPGAGMAAGQTAEERIELALARAGESGAFVLDLLNEKLAEGRAKGVDVDRIAAALERRTDALTRASEMLSGQTDVDAAALDAVANAYESGVSQAVLTSVFDTAPRERRFAAVAALSQLVEDGHTPSDALQRVQDALARGADLPGPAAAASGAPAGVPAGPPAVVPTPGAAPQGARPAGRPPLP